MSPETEILKWFGVEPPRTRSKSAAKSLVAYLVKGNGAGSVPDGEDERLQLRRATILRREQERWIGKEVRFLHFPAKKGRVKYLIAKRKDAVEQARALGRAAHEIAPFLAYLEVPGAPRNYEIVSIDNLRLTD